MMKQQIISISAVLTVLFFLPFGKAGVSFAQNNAIILDGAFIVLDGGTSAINIYLVVDQSSTSGIIRPGGGHISSEGQYNFVKWNSGTSTGNYVFPFGVGGNAADYIPFTFNKTTAGNSDVSMSTWTTNQQNIPHPTISNVAAVTNMIGIPDSVKNAIDRFWDIQSPSVIGNLTFSYRGSENTTAAPTDTFKTQHWNGTAWDPQAGPGNSGVTTGIGTVGPIPGRTTFSPWVLTRADLSPTILSSQNLTCNSQCTGKATVTATGGTPPYTYVWNPSSQTALTATGLCAGTYSVIVTDAASITAIDTVTITQPTALSSSVTPTNVTCNSLCNGHALLSASGGTPGYSYSWNTVPVQTTTNVTGLCAGIFSCTITDANSCTHTNTIAITQPSAITVSTTATPAACSSSTGTSVVNASGGTGGYTYSWIISPVQTSQTATGLAAGSYSVIVADANGCTQTHTVAVTSVNTLSVSATSTQTGCTVNNGTAIANPTSGTLPYSYNWNIGQTTPTATGLSAGTYTITVTDANGCTKTQSVNVTTVPGPTAAATASIIFITLGGNTQLTATGGGTYSWSPTTGLSCTTCVNPTATPTTTTNYCVFVTDAAGCKDSACVAINVEIPCGELFIPNAFSPNHDGENDMHCVLGNCIESFHITIYDRWGEKVFESSDQKTCWDGTNKGQLENSAVFIYYMEATLTSGEKIKKKGNISLVR